MDIACLYKGHCQSGFSLVELVTTLAVSSILITVGIPSMQQLMASQRMTASVNTVVSHLHLARSEAIKYGFHAVLCPSPDGDACIKSMQWQQGFILFVDENVNRKRDPGEKLLRWFQPGSRGQQIRISTTTGRRWIRYQSTGLALGSNVTITFCDSGGFVAPKAVIISNTGRPRISTEKPNGDSLVC